MRTARWSTARSSARRARAGRPRRREPRGGRARPGRGGGEGPPQGRAGAGGPRGGGGGGGRAGAVPVQAGDREWQADARMGAPRVRMDTGITGSFMNKLKTILLAVALLSVAAVAHAQPAKD